MSMKRMEKEKKEGRGDVEEGGMRRLGEERRKASEGMGSQERRKQGGRG